MPEWSNGPDSKSGVGLVFTVGSNPTLSATSIPRQYGQGGLVNDPKRAN